MKIVNQTRSPAVAEKADRTAYNAITTSKTHLCLQQCEQNSHVIMKARYNKETKISKFWGQSFKKWDR